MKINFFKLSKQQKIRIRKNFFSNISSQTLQVITQLSYPPLMILAWGVESFGIWIFFTSIPNILAIFNLNFNNAVIQEMTIFHSKGNKSKVEQIFQNGIALTILSILLFSLVALCSYFFFTFDFSIAKSLSTYEINLILLLLIISFLIEIFSSIFISGINFQGKQFVVLNIRTSFDFILKVGIIILGVFFESLIYIAILFIIFSICKSLAYFYYFLKNNKYLTISLDKVTLKITFRLLKLSTGHTLETLHYLIKHHGLVVLMGIFFNAPMIVYITTFKTLFYFFPFNILTSLNNITVFEYARLFAKKKLYEFKYNHKRYILLISGILIIIMIGSATVGPIIYAFWLNNRFDFSYIFLLLVLLDVSIQILISSILAVMKSLNIFFKINLFEFITITVSIFISYYFLSMGYSFLSYFIIMLVSSSIVLICSIYMLDNFYKKLIQ